MNKKNISIFFALWIAIGLIAGCSSEGEELKSELQEAFSKQAEVKHYRFNGSLSLQANLSSVVPNQNALTSGLLSLLSHSETSWQGVTDLEQSHMEADILVAPHQTDTSFELPIIIKDNKLYFNIPLLTVSEEEYLTIDLDEDHAKSQGFVFDSILAHLIHGIDAKWFKEGKSSSKQAKTVVIEITKENVAEIMRTIQNQLPQIADDLENKGLLSQQQAEQLRNQDVEKWNDAVKDLTIDQSGLISFTINQNGYIIAQQLGLYFSNQSIELVHNIENINENPPFTKELPELTRSLDELFK